MYIRQTTIKSKKSGAYFTYRLVESNRINGKVKQQTLLNLGRQFPIKREQWKSLVARIEALLHPQQAFAFELLPEGENKTSQQIETEAQHITAQLLARGYGEMTPKAQYQRIELDSVEAYRPRTVGIEQLALHAFKQLGFIEKLQDCGFNQPQLAGAIGCIIGRMAKPASELATHQWLQKESALGELIGFDYEKMGHDRLYQVSDLLWKHKKTLEKHLFKTEQNLFSLDETIVLYDLTNTFFEGNLLDAEKAQRGRSKEKRSDCPLITLGLVLDGSGFPRQSEHFAGNISEPSTLEIMLTGLSIKPRGTVVLDAGIASEDNIQWLVEKGYHYIVVSRKQHRQFDPEKAKVVKGKDGQEVKAEKIQNPETNEVLLYCHSEAREAKEQAMFDKPQKAFEAALDSLHQGLSKNRTTKKSDLIQQRIGRLKEKYSRAAQHYQISVDEKEGKAIAIHWKLNKKSDSKANLPGVYCLRSSHTDWDEKKLWQTYTMLTTLEGVFRSLKSEMGMRPIFHQKQERIDGHLFITLLAYHLVHTLRMQLKSQGIHHSWDHLRRLVQNRQRVSFMADCEDGRTLHLRKTTRIEPHQAPIFEALGLATDVKTTAQLV